MTSMIIDRTPHDPKTPSYHMFCLIDCILLPSVKLIGIFLLITHWLWNSFNPHRLRTGTTFYSQQVK